MEQSSDSKQKYNFLIAGIVIVILILGFFLFRHLGSSTPVISGEQTNTENTNSVQNDDKTVQNTNSSANDGQKATSNEITSGNVAAAGILGLSDNPSRGNLMLDSSRGKIYVKTGRDFSSLVGKNVTLKAKGPINSFIFLGFNSAKEDGSVAGTSTTDTTAMGGGDEKPGAVSLSGTLATSDNLAKGNYIINSSAGKIYYRSKQEHSAWIGANVELTAAGTINNFNGATLDKK